jgi:hypothetical protein
MDEVDDMVSKSGDHDRDSYIRGQTLMNAVHPMPTMNTR